MFYFASFAVGWVGSGERGAGRVSVSELGVEQSHAKSTLSRLAQCLQRR
jgi:hypothetical protein